MDGLFIDALKFASDKHVSQRRKGCDVPYINHPIKVVEILHKIGGENNNELLSAALLHDVLEDTTTTEQEIRVLFGDHILDIVKEVTDDMKTTYDERKREQIRKAPFLSSDAKKIKIADKIANIWDMMTLPVNWSGRRKRQYLEWSQRVVEGCRNVNPALDKAFDDILVEANSVLRQNGQ